MARIERSRVYIKEALLQLLKKRKYDEITINDIVEKAGVSKMTFYRQFYDKKSVLKYIIDERTNEYIEKYKNHSPEDHIRISTQLLVEGKEFTRILIESDLYSLITEKFAQLIIKENTYAEHFIAGGIANIYYYYVTSNREETPEEFADIISKFLNIEYLKKEVQ